jgi:lysophospholipase L1-like esterase
MRRAVIAILFVSCGGAADVTVRAPASPTAPPTTAAPTPTRSPSPSPTVAATASPSGSATPIVRASGAIHYVAIGASDTVGVGSLDPANGSWPSRIAALLPAGSTYRNLGVSGSLAAQAQRDQLPLAVREQPTIVTVWLAVNDLNAQVPAATYGAALEAILGALVKGTSARIFVGNVPDLRGVPVYAALDPLVVLAQVQIYNAAIEAAVAKYSPRAVRVDLLTGSLELTTKITVAGDGFHPSDEGYALIAQRFADAMRKGGVPLRVGP